MVNMSPVRESLRDSSSESGSESDNASASLRSSRSGSRASQAPVQTSSNASGRRVSRSASQSPVEMDVDVPLVPEVVHDTITLEDTGSRGSSQPELTSQELYALLQALWRDNELVKFSDLIPKTMYTKRDAATAFAILLEIVTGADSATQGRQFRFRCNASVGGSGGVPSIVRRKDHREGFLAWYLRLSDESGISTGSGCPVLNA